MTLPKELHSRLWRLTHLYKIKDKQGAIRTFKPNTIQLTHLRERGKHRYNLIVKYRQGGITTLYAIDLLDQALWHPGISCAIIAHEAKKLPEYFDIVKRAYENLPAIFKPKTKTDTKYKYDFATRFDGAPLDSSIYVAVKLRGGTVQRLHITESAYIKDRVELAAGSKQAVPIGGYISEETTGNGFNDFYDTYMQFHSKTNIGEFDYKTYFYPWFIDPQYTLPGEVPDPTPVEAEMKIKYNLTDGQLLWRRWKMGELRKDQSGIGLSGEQLFKQEYPMTLQEAFQSGAGAVFDGEKVDNIRPVDPLTLDQCLAKIDELYHIEDDLNAKLKEQVRALYQLGVWFWEMPRPKELYVVGCDPSDGQGADYGPIDVWHDEGLRQVAQFYGKVRPDELAEICAALGTFYNNAYVGVENNMLTTILFLSKIYSNYYFETRIDERSLKRTKKIGYNTNTKTRDVMIDDYIIAFDEGTLTIRSKITAGEMKTFVRKDNGKREHADGKFDDCLFAAFIALQMRKFNKRKARAFNNPAF